MLEGYLCNHTINKKLLIFSCFENKIIIEYIVSLFIEVKNLLLTCNLRKIPRNHLRRSPLW